MKLLGRYLVIAIVKCRSRDRFIKSYWRLSPLALLLRPVAFIANFVFVRHSAQIPRDRARWKRTHNAIW